MDLTPQTSEIDTQETRIGLETLAGGPFWSSLCTIGDWGQLQSELNAERLCMCFRASSHCIFLATSLPALQLNPVT